MNYGNQNYFNAGAVNSYGGQIEAGIMPYNNSGITPEDGQQIQITHVNIDVADIVRAIFDGINIVYANNIDQSKLMSQVGQVKEVSNQLSDSQPIQCQTEYKTKQWIGVYGSNGYGIFNNMAKFQEALKFLQNPCYDNFYRIDEAVDYATQGIAHLIKIPIDDLVDTHKINWVTYVK
ncbi:MAG: hypothetical protein H6Q69_2406 [Firmicutes bacterium]|nr:hypothetical protein [Bacillota bacterium]